MSKKQRKSRNPSKRQRKPGKPSSKKQRKPSSRKQYTAEELQRASLVTQHDLVAMATAYSLLLDLGTHWGSEPNPQEKALSNAFLDSLSVRTRNLLSFLYSHKSKPNAIIAEDFFDHPKEWQQNRPIPEPEIAGGKLRGQISECFTHMTWEQTKTTKTLWGYYKIVQFIVSGLQSFVRLVDDDEKIHTALLEDLDLIAHSLLAMMKKWGPATAPVTEVIEFDEYEYFNSSST